jgi:hypothetical protein
MANGRYQRTGKQKHHPKRMVFFMDKGGDGVSTQRLLDEQQLTQPSGGLSDVQHYGDE